jgi:hypothetical protein
MIPSTLMAIGFARQTNIGLDKENFTEHSLTTGLLRKQHPAFDLFNAQFVQNLNTKLF